MTERIRITSTTIPGVPFGTEGIVVEDFGPDVFYRYDIETLTGIECIASEEEIEFL